MGKLYQQQQGHFILLFHQAGAVSSIGAALFQRMSIALYKPWRRGSWWPANLMSIRTDRTKGNRGAFEAARLKVLKTQTICGICGKPVDFSYKNPHPLAPTVDHIIPVSKGGHPTDLSNLQLAHRYCNRAKSDKLYAPLKAEENDKLVPNDALEQHADWIAYRSK